MKPIAGNAPPLSGRARSLCKPSHRSYRASRRCSPNRFFERGDTNGTSQCRERSPVGPFTRECCRLPCQLHRALAETERPYSSIRCRRRSLAKRVFLIGMKIRWTQSRSGPVRVFANQGQRFGQRADLTVCSEAQYEIVVGKEPHRRVESANLFDQRALHEHGRNRCRDLEPEQRFEDVPRNRQRQKV